ncbi:unnamed protein product [Knipowitschia caucasica]|uniref:Uncharacterized protein n=1 Tax=Knipowitschia caucasica TaxID=637954 RepID=A0AAV2M847_KNICA
MTMGDVIRIASELSLTTCSKLEKGYKLFVEKYVFNYEDKPEIWRGSCEGDVHQLFLCFRKDFVQPSG